MTPEWSYPGLQSERTQLAWRRTVVALAVGSLVSLRLLPPVLGSWSLSVGFGGLAASWALWGATRHRAARVQNALRCRTDALPGGALLLNLALIVVAAAGLGLFHCVDSLALARASGSVV